MRVAPMNSRFLDACRRRPTDVRPVWFMRQAGRYMKQYREIRAKHGILEICKRPDLAATVTLQPVEILDVDAAIIFADLLLPVEPMGLKLRFVSGVGQDLLRFFGQWKFSGRRNAIDEEAVAFDFSTDLFGLDVEAGEDLLDDLFPFAEHAEEDVLGLDDARAELRRFVAGEKESAAGFLVVFLEHDLFYRCFNPPLHLKHPITARCKIMVMSNYNRGEAPLRMALTHQIENTCARFEVEIAGRLVCQKELRVGQQGAGDGHSLLFTT